MRPTAKPVPFFLLTSLLLLACCLLFNASAFAEPLRFQTAKAAFDKGDFAAAFKIFHSLVQQQPGDPETDFLLGRSAFEIGDFETAIFSFERVLISQPDADRVRLELARSYLQIGDLESANSNFNRVLAKNPPVTVRQNVERYLKLISQAAQQHNFSGSLSLGLSSDSNVYASPADEQIRTLFGTLSLTGNTATPREDLISRSILQFKHLYRRHPQQVGWLSSFTAYSAVYSKEDDLNLNLLAVGSGPIWQNGKRQTKLQGAINYLTLDGERYLSIYNLSAEHSWPLTKTEQATLSGQLGRLNYAADSRDATQLRLASRLLWQLPKGSLLGTLGIEKNWAREKQQTYLRPSLSLQYQRPLRWQMTGLLAIRLQASQYDGKIPAFGKGRSDFLRELSLGVVRPVWKAPSGNGQLQAQLLAVASDVESNIDLYQYDKQVFSFTLSYLF
jgi:tetratricopeptide (TPR) repeat protein